MELYFCSQEYCCILLYLNLSSHSIYNINVTLHNSRNGQIVSVRLTTPYGRIFPMIILQKNKQPIICGYGVGVAGEASEKL